MEKLQIALIGCGRISLNHIIAISKNSNAILVSVCDLIECRAEERAKKYKELCGLDVNVYNNYKEMLKSENIDIVTIATESGYHASIAKYCLNSNIHVIVEKPMALSTKDADEMIDLAREKKLKLTVCHQNRFNKTIKYLKNEVRSGEFGKLINVTARILWNRNDDYYKQAPWRGTWELDGGTLMNQCIHNIDLLQWVMESEVETIYSQIGTYLRNIEAEDFGAILIRFKNGAIGIVEGSACVYPKNLEETLSVFGDNGTAVVGGVALNKMQTWRVNGQDEEEVKKYLQEEVENVYGSGHLMVYQDFIDSVQNNRKPLISGEDGRIAMQIVLGAYMSAKLGLPIDFSGLKFSTIDMRES